jgi:hypothetical protein
MRSPSSPAARVAGRHTRARKLWTRSGPPSGVQAGAEGDDPPLDLTDAGGVGDHGASNDIGVAIEELGSRVDDHVGTKREGLDGECRGEGVVDHQADAAPVSQFGDRGNIEHAKLGIGQRLGVGDRRRPSRKHGLPVREIGGCDEVDPYPERGQITDQQVAGYRRTTPRAATMRPPARHSDSSVMAIAPIPLLVMTAAWPPSSRATPSAAQATVGLPNRVYQVCSNPPPWTMSR